MLRLLFPYLLFGALALIVVFDNASTRVLAAQNEDGVALVEVGRDPVCNMDVGGRITAIAGSKRYHLCSERCRDLFVADPAKYVAESCPVCKAETGERVQVTRLDPAYTWQGRTYRFCKAEHRDLFATDPGGYFIHTMWGIPSWLYSVSIALVLVLSFGLFELTARRARARAGPPVRASVFRIPGLLALFRWPGTRFAFQLVFVAFFALIVVAGLFGDQLAARNVAPLLTWTIWWGGLVVLILFLGKAWCYVCPWDAVAGWVEKLGLWGKRREGLSLGLAWPKRMRNIVLATTLFVGLTWLELGFGITMKPRATAILGLAMLTMTLVCVLVFERRAFCRYACLVGRVSGLYATFAATEVRAADPGECRKCATRDCYHGNERGEGCPTGLFPGSLDLNTYCIDCLECVKTCPTGNMVVRARPWASDLAKPGRPRKDEAYLALLMLSITGFHGLTMTRVWSDLLAAFENRLGLGYVPAFSLGMLVIMGGPILIYAGLVELTTRIARSERVGYGRAFVAFAYSLLPIALFYHLAHNLEHLLVEGQKVIPLLSNPLGYAPGQGWNLLGVAGTGPWNLLGTADWTPAPLVSLPTLWLLQVILVLTGHVYALWVADKTARRLYPEGGRAWRSQVPMLAGMVLFSVFSLWLLKQPMQMRTSVM